MSTFRRRRPANFRCRRCKSWFGYGSSCVACGVDRERPVRRTGQIRPRVV